jgi:hypothetical protein
MSRLCHYKGPTQPHLLYDTHTHGAIRKRWNSMLRSRNHRILLTCYHSTGAPLGPLKMWEKVLYNGVHKVKTGFGLSKGGYAFTPGSPIYGPGQGSRGGPGSCSTMTSLLIDGMPRLCHGIQFTDPSQQLEYTVTVSMFVDDASNSTNNFLS